MCNAIFWQSEVLAQLPNFVHIFTPRGFNMSPHSGPGTDNTRARWRAVCAALGVPHERLVAGRQVHRAGIAHVISRGDGADGAQILEGIDGLVTTERSVPLMALSADCPLVILYDTRRHVLGLAHSGWRGTLAGMPAKIVKTLQSDCGASPNDLLAVISPSALACCYEIQDDVRRQVIDASGSDHRIRTEGGATYLDLAALIVDQLLAAGLADKAVHLPERCTICDNRFHSYRREGPDTGHAAMFACLL